MIFPGSFQRDEQCQFSRLGCIAQGVQGMLLSWTRHHWDTACKGQFPESAFFQDFGQSFFSRNMLTGMFSVCWAPCGMCV